MTAPREKKSDLTRRKLVEVSQRLFLQQGFEATTMREVARAAGLAPGAAYYYFDSKEALIFDLYERTFTEHLPQAEAVLRAEKKLQPRIAGLISAHLKASEPYHELSRVLYRIAADPLHPLSPFSEASKGLRDRNIALMARALDGQGLDAWLQEQLPELLWMLKMAMLLYWLHDRSPKRRKTYELVDRCAGLTAKLVSVAHLPLLKGFSKDLVGLYYSYKPF
jgi:AcrR family transcriptional regulator